MLFQKKLTLKEKYTPKVIQISKLYTANTKGGRISGHDIDRISRALKKSGFSDTDIRNTIYKDKPVTVVRMKEISEILNRNRVYGFEKSPETAIKAFLNKERVKAQTIAGIRKEHILEAAEENETSYGTTSLNPKGVSPNAPKPGEGSILRRRGQATNAVRSLSGKAGAQTVSSLSDRPKTNTLSPLRSTGKGGGIISSRPKF